MDNIQDTNNENRIIVWKYEFETWYIAQRDVVDVWDQAIEGNIFAWKHFIMKCLKMWYAVMSSIC
jgi:hypothetical protein